MPGASKRFIRKVCPRCETLSDCVIGDRFCVACTAKLLKEMRESGYLTDIPRKLPERSLDAREDTYETKHGYTDR